jgi:hypothetical protein
VASDENMVSLKMLIEFDYRGFGIVPKFFAWLPTCSDPDIFGPATKFKIVLPRRQATVLSFPQSVSIPRRTKTHKHVRISKNRLFFTQGGGALQAS